jgi:hypothetical protein
MDTNPEQAADMDKIVTFDEHTRAVRIRELRLKPLLNRDEVAELVHLLGADGSNGEPVRRAE